MMGPIRGEINIAPIITAAELVFNPNEAINIANTKIRIVEPLNYTPARIASIEAASSSLS